MKYRKFATVVLLLVVLSISLHAVAADSQGARAAEIENALKISVFYQKGEDRIIKCFDVNEDGWFAIGYRNNTIHIYDDLGLFQYGYSFQTEGTYGIELKKHSIILYLGRSNTAVEINTAGKCVSAEKIAFTQDIKDILNRTEKQIRNARYHLERDIGIFNGAYSRLVKMDETETVLYDVTTRGYWVGTAHYLILGLFLIGGIATIAVKLKREKS